MEIVASSRKEQIGLKITLNSVSNSLKYKTYKLAIYFVLFKSVVMLTLEQKVVLHRCMFMSDSKEEGLFLDQPSCFRTRWAGCDCHFEAA